jgi:hypothetical protein
MRGAEEVEAIGFKSLKERYMLLLLPGVLRATW